MTINTIKRLGNKRINNLELRWTNCPVSEGYYEIVCWQGEAEKEYCYSLAMWYKDSEGWNLRFVGNRPFDSWKVDRHLFWQLAKYGDTVANAEFALEQKMDDYKNHIYS
jgi:hypothetical protein